MRIACLLDSGYEDLEFRKPYDAFRAAGHDVEVLTDAYSDIMGHAGAVVLHSSGTLEGAHDPRADGPDRNCEFRRSGGRSDLLEERRPRRRREKPC